MGYMIILQSLNFRPLSAALAQSEMPPAQWLFVRLAEHPLWRCLHVLLITCADLFIIDGLRRALEVSFFQVFTYHSRASYCKGHPF